MRLARLAAAVLFIAGMALGTARADDQLQKVTMVWAGKGMSFIMQYVAMGAGYYKDEGIELETIDVSSGTRMAAAVMGGSADFTQLGMPHTLRAVARGGDLVAIGEGFDKYPIALVISKAAAQRQGITDAMSPDEKIKRIRGLKIGITSPGSSTDEFMRTIMMVRGMDPDKDIKLQPIGIGAPMVVATQQGSIDGFSFMSPFTDSAVSRGIATVIADPMQDTLPEYQNVPYQIITTSRKIIAEKRPLLLASLRAMTRAINLCRTHPDQAKKIVRAYFKEVDENDFNISFDTYVKAVPATPIVSEIQVANTLKMLNLSEKTPISVSYDQVTDMSIAREAANALLGK
jgi:NitT/TauT family transport system substrate-binding protein